MIQLQLNLHFVYVVYCGTKIAAQKRRFSTPYSRLPFDRLYFLIVFAISNTAHKFAVEITLGTLDLLWAICRCANMQFRWVCIDGTCDIIFDERWCKIEFIWSRNSLKKTILVHSNWIICIPLGYLSIGPLVTFSSEIFFLQEERVSTATTNSTSQSNQERHNNCEWHTFFEIGSWFRHILRQTEKNDDE